MNIKKYLRERAEKDAEALLTEEDKLFIQQLIQKNEESERQKSAEELSEKVQESNLIKP